MCWGPRPGDCRWFSSSFAIFIALIWVSLFMVPNNVIIFALKVFLIRLYVGSFFLFL